MNAADASSVTVESRARGQARSNSKHLPRLKFKRVRGRRSNGRRVESGLGFGFAHSGTRLPKGASQAFCGLLNGPLLGANQSLSWLNPDAFHLQQGRGLVEQLSQVVVFALDGAEMDGERQHSTFAPPSGIDDDLSSSGLGTHIFGRYPVDPGLSWGLHTFTVVAYESQHMELECRTGLKRCSGQYFSRAAACLLQPG